MNTPSSELENAKPKLRISLFVQGSPWTSRACRNALNFARALIESRHEIHRVFFYQDAVGISHVAFDTPTDEPNLQREWLDLSRDHQIELAVCVSAAQRRGISSDRDQNTVATGFEIRGLGQLIEAMLESERLVSFSA